MPCYHEISHNVKARAKKFGVDVVFSTDFKLGNLTPFLGERKGCQKAHGEKSLTFENGVVYEIPLFSGFRYVGQTSRCLKDRLPEHRRNVKIKAPNSKVPKHAQECCNCTIQ